MGKIKLNSSLTFQEAFEDFLFYKQSEGITDKTLSSYRSHFQCITKYIDPSMYLSSLTKNDIQQMIVEMKKKNLRTNTIASYVRVLRVFINWARCEGLTDITIPSYKTEETIKETYSDEELALLLKKPDLHTCQFSEYRTWVILNFLLNSGARSSTIRNIKVGDVDLARGIITYRHNKNHHIQVIPLCSQMISILKEYMHYRNGKSDDFLFCRDDGNMLSSDGLRSSFVRYNKSRNVSKTSIHLFRHTFAKKYLLDCGGDAFTLQRLLGHSTLDMTRHYCNIYNVDLVKSFDEYSPLQNMRSNKEKIRINK